MARRISLAPHITVEELGGRYRSTKDPVERSRWHFLQLLARGMTATTVAAITGYSAFWIESLGATIVTVQMTCKTAGTPYVLGGRASLALTVLSYGKPWPDHIPMAIAGAGERWRVG